jgi:hypothetical protein
MSEQIVTISPRATAFTAVCDECARSCEEPGWAAATFAGELDLDLGAGVFLCRRGHRIKVRRAKPPPSFATEAA